jgi:HSP20 family protein
VEETQTPDFLLEGGRFLDPFALGSWTPNVDICETRNRILVHVELPGVDSSDVSVSFQGGDLRIQGIKREPTQSQKLLCYYCLERRYGKIDRIIHIGLVVNPKTTRASMENGILTIILPKLNDRRGNKIEIQIKEKK